MHRDIASLDRRLRDPEPQILALLLLGLERERIVAVGYRDDVLAARLDATELPAEVREALASALRRVWKDEEMHARYLQGLLLRQRALGTRVRASLQNAAGLVGGWVASIEQLRRQRDAPLAHAAAEAMKLAGSLSGRIPAEARAGLSYQTIHAYALWNVDAEMSAVAGYERILILLADARTRGPAGLALPSSIAAEIDQARREELEHVGLFAELVAVTDPDRDALLPGVDAAAFAHTLGRWTMASRHGEDPAPRATTSATVVVRRGGKGRDKRALVREAVMAAGLERVVAQRAEETGKAIAELAVAVKVDFMLGYDRADSSTVVDPALVESLALALRETGVGDVAVVEARNLYDHFFANRDVASVAGYFGYASPAYRVVDLSLEQERHAFERGMALETIGRTWRDADVRVSFAKLKTDPSEQFHLTLKNLCNVVEQRGEYLFRDRHADLHAALMELLFEFPVHFGVIDAYDSAADGMLGVIACRRPPAPERVYASSDLFALDAVAARHMGIGDPRSSAVYREGTYWFDAPSGPIVVDGPDEAIDGWRTARRGPYERLLGLLARPVFEYASGRGSLFVPRMDPSAFPPLEHGRAIRAARAVVRKIVGI